MSESQSSPVAPNNIHYIPVNPANPYHQPRPEEPKLFAGSQSQQFYRAPNVIPQNNPPVPFNAYSPQQTEEQKVYVDSQYQSYNQAYNPIPQSIPSNPYHPQQTDKQNLYAPSPSQNYYPAPNGIPQNNPSVPINDTNSSQQLYAPINSMSQNHPSNPFSINPPPQSEEEKVYDEISSRQSFCQTISAIHKNDIPFNPVNVFDKIQGIVLKDQFKTVQTPDFKKDINVDERIETISKSWIKIDKMKDFGKFKQTFVNCIDQLLKEGGFVGWKKSRGDGNCYYRAVIAKYFEFIHKPYYPISYLINFKDILEKCIYQRKQQFSQDEYLTACESILQYINYSILHKNNYPVEIFIKALEWLQIEDIDLALVRIARLITYIALQDEKENPQFKEFGLDISWYEGSILLMGEEAEGFMLVFLPLGLKCQVTQFNIFDKIQTENFPVGDNFDIKIPIVRRSGHYDILYTIQEMEYEQYSFETGEYHIHNAFLSSSTN